MDNQSKDIEILGGKFILDWKNHTLTQIEQPSNSIFLGPPSGDGGYEFLFDKNSRTVFKDPPQEAPPHAAITKVRILIPETMRLAANLQQKDPEIDRYLSAARLVSRILSPFQQTPAKNTAVRI